MVAQTKIFQGEIWNYYQEHKRILPWRETRNPYHILVSEVMLQQTQVERVKGFYDAFLRKFPDVESLARAPLSEVLPLWKGLGYNRRAVNLKKTAEEIVRRNLEDAENVKGENLKKSSKVDGFPRNYSELLSLPGVGPSTAGAVMNFAYNIPTAFIETNIRTVYLHFFFKDKEGVSDKEILSLVEQTQDMKNPRDWYYALYDYGVMLKKTVGNLNTRSKHYKKQSTFKGSNRELRAQILFYLLEKKRATVSQTATHLKRKDDEVKAVLETFVKEGTMKKKGLSFEIV
jgi:A/G-specific adenine glycosylase